MIGTTPHRHRVGDDTRRRWRRRLAAVVLVGALGAHLGFLVNGAFDPHKRFGFRPFNESDTWRADIVRVQSDGEVRPVNDGTWEYDWNDLVDPAKLGSPWALRHAKGGAEATLDLLGRALDWIADNTPADLDTVRIEATVTVIRAGRDPTTHHIVSKSRTAA